MLGLILGLDMDRDPRAWNSVPKRVLDVVADVVRPRDGHAGRNHEMKLDECSRACGARLQVVGLDGALRGLGDAGLDGASVSG